MPPALMAATPVGATTIIRLAECSLTAFRKVVLPVPALPVRKMLIPVCSTNSHAVASSLFCSIVHVWLYSHYHIVRIQASRHHGYLSPPWTTAPLRHHLTKCQTHRMAQSSSVIQSYAIFYEPPSFFQSFLVSALTSPYLHAMARGSYLKCQINITKKGYPSCHLIACQKTYQQPIDIRPGRIHGAPVIPLVLIGSMTKA